jgi:protein-S-isoprenylcysteine O-methyltransferase Ste14
MLTGAIIIVAVLALAALVVTFFVARRALRLFLRLALVLLFAILLLVGYVAWRWQPATPTREPARNERRQSAPARH